MSNSSKGQPHKTPPAFGKLNQPLKPTDTAPKPHASNRKRSIAVTLAVLGTGAFGLIALAGSRRCEPQDPADPAETCRSSRSTSSSSGGGHGSWSRASTSSITRGGFGKSGMSFSGHAGS